MITLADDLLVRELATVVTVGWELPLLPDRWGEVSNLTILVDNSELSTYRELAERLLHKLDAALEAAYTDERITEDQWEGLRILFGLHIDYRTERSPTRRRAVAGTYLVPSWRGRFPGTDADELRMAETFRRKHQQKALRLALACYLDLFGRPPLSTVRGDDQVRETRLYIVDSQRQVRLHRCTDVIRALQEPFTGTSVWLPSYTSDEGARATRFTVLKHPDDNRINVTGPVAVPERPREHMFVLDFERPYHVGELIEYSYELSITYEDDITIWDQYFVATDANNDDYVLDMTVQFESEPPSKVWAMESVATMSQSDIGPEQGTVIGPSPDGTFHYEWRTTQRRISYGLQWRWGIDW